MLTLIVKLTARAGQEAEVERILRAVVPKVHEEPGNHAYILHRSPDKPRVFLCYEAYSDQAALEAHRVHLHEMGVDLRPLLEGPPLVEFYERLA